MKLINIGLEIRNPGNTLGFDNQKLAELKLMLPQMVKSVTENQIILFNCNDGMFHAVKPGYSLFKSGERIGSQKTGQPANGARWRLEMTNGDGYVYIKNMFTNEYLYTTEQKHPRSSNCKMVSLSTTPAGYEFKWYFEYMDTGFYIKNARNAQYLDDGYSENNNYHVFTREEAFRMNTYKC